MRSIAFALFALGCAASVSAAENPRQNILVGSADRFLCQLVDGDGWSTSFFLPNLDTKTIYFAVRFFDANFNPLPLPLQGGTGPAAATVIGTIGVGQSVAFATPGTSAQLMQGWALVFTLDRPANQSGAVLTNDAIGGQAVFRQRVAGRPDFEAVVTMDRPSRRLRIPFDNRNDFSTGIAVVNADSTPMPIAFSGRNLLGNTLFTETMTLVNGGKMVFSMPERFPASNGQIGILEITTPGTMGVAGLGLRFNPGGAFTSVPAIATQ